MFCRTSNLKLQCLTSRRSQPPLALAVPLSRFTSRVGGGSAFFVRHQAAADGLAVDLSLDFGLRKLQTFWMVFGKARAGFVRQASAEPFGLRSLGFIEL
jgi:hypothetical protein